MQFANNEELQKYRHDLESRRSEALRKIEEASVDLFNGRISKEDALKVRLAADKVMEEYYRFALRYCENSGKVKS